MSSKPFSTAFVDPRDKAANDAKKKEKKALLDRAFDRIIGSQLSKFQAAPKGHTEEDDEVYRLQLQEERDAASKRKRKVLTKEQEELASKGLSGQVVALMAKVDSKDDKKKKSKKRKKSKSKRKHYNSSSSESSDDSSEEERRRRKRKKRRKEEKRKKRAKRRDSSVDSDSDK